MSTRLERQIEWRRSKVAELDSQGRSQPEIAKILEVSIGTVNGDLAYLRQQAKHNIRKYIDERLPHEYEKSLLGLTLIQREAWATAQSTEDPREKIQALSLAKECYAMKMELLTNATVVDDAIKFVAASANNKETITAEPEIDINPDRFDLVNEREQPRTKPSTQTTNQVF